MKPMAYFLRLVLAIVLALPVFSSAEILHEIYPFDTLKTVKQKYPNARFVKVQAAWVTEDQSFFSMEGQGFPGTLRILFTDYRPDYRRNIAEKCNATEDSVLCPFYRTGASASDDDALKTLWVRWVPPRPIPIARYISKYGEPTKYDFESSDMTPFATWDKVALHAQLSDDKLQVMFVTTNFTKAELREAWLRIANFVPEHLREEEAPPRVAPTTRTETPGRAKK